MNKDQVRKAFPTCCTWADSYREVFGEGTKILYAKEGGHEIGKPVEDGVKTKLPHEYLEVVDKKNIKKVKDEKITWK